MIESEEIIEKCQNGEKQIATVMSSLNLWQILSLSKSRDDAANLAAVEEAEAPLISPMLGPEWSA